MKHCQEEHFRVRKGRGAELVVSIAPNVTFGGQENGYIVSWATGEGDERSLIASCQDRELDLLIKALQEAKEKIANRTS